MFGFVSANIGELTPEQKQRYHAVYCGICRQIRERHRGLARLALSYDMAFLALLLMSLYEPEETDGVGGCMMHPVKPRAWVDNGFIRYAADMNVALAYYNAQDDVNDDGSLSARAMTLILGKTLPEIQQRWPRQCQAIENCIQRLRELERDRCENPDVPAGCFGELMGQLLTYQEDLWADSLGQMGMALGRFIYLADAAIDYRRDQRKKRYNPFLAMDTGEDWSRWEQYLMLTMGRCTAYFERLPLVQDKKLLDNILYSGVWSVYRRKQREGEKSVRRNDNGRSL